MTKSQKLFLILNLIFIAPILLFLIGIFLGGGRQPIYILYIGGYIGIHWVFFLINIKAKGKLKLFSYAPTIFFFLLALLFTIVVIINAQANSNGGFNEDYSGAFAVIAFALTVISFGYTFLFNRMWFKVDSMNL